MIVSIIFVQFFSSCKSNLSISKEKQKKGTLLKWEHTLDAGKKEVKNYWVDLVDGNWDFFKKSYNTELNDSDIQKLELVPMLVYTIDSIDFANISSKTSPAIILKLNTEKAIFEGLKDNKFVVAIHAKYVDNKWKNEGGYSGIYPVIADKLFDLYFNEKTPFFEVDVNAFPSQHYLYNFLVYKENGEYKCIKMTGKTPLLTDELIELREYLRKAKSEVLHDMQ